MHTVQGFPHSHPPLLRPSLRFIRWGFFPSAQAIMAKGRRISSKTCRNCNEAIWSCKRRGPTWSFGICSKGLLLICARAIWRCERFGQGSAECVCGDQAVHEVLPECVQGQRGMEGCAGGLGCMEGCGRERTGGGGVQTRPWCGVHGYVVGCTCVERCAWMGYGMVWRSEGGGGRGVQGMGLPGCDEIRTGGMVRRGLDGPWGRMKEVGVGGSLLVTSPQPPLDSRPI